MSENEIIEHNLDKCNLCGASLEDVPIEKYIIRQVVDIPKIKATVTEFKNLNSCTT